MSKQIAEWSEWARRRPPARDLNSSMPVRVFVTPRSDERFVRVGPEYLGPPLWALERARFVRDFARVV